VHKHSNWLKNPSLQYILDRLWDESYSEEEKTAIISSETNNPQRR